MIPISPAGTDRIDPGSSLPTSGPLNAEAVVPSKFTGPASGAQLLAAPVSSPSPGARPEGPKENSPGQASASERRPGLSSDDFVSLSAPGRGLGEVSVSDRVQHLVAAARNLREQTIAELDALSRLLPPDDFCNACCGIAKEISALNSALLAGQLNIRTGVPFFRPLRP